jgi:hypothetical protein
MLCIQYNPSMMNAVTLISRHHNRSHAHTSIRSNLKLSGWSAPRNTLRDCFVCLFRLEKRMHIPPSVQIASPPVALSCSNESLPHLLHPGRRLQPTAIEQCVMGYMRVYVEP